MDTITIAICLLVILFTLAIMIIGTVKRGTAKLELIAYGLRSINGQLIGGIISIVLFIFLLYVLFVRVQEMTLYLFNSPTFSEIPFSSGWELLFDQKLMDRLETEAYKQKDYSLWIKIIDFRSFIFKNSLSIVSFLYTGTLGLFLGLQKSIIFRTGFIKNFLGTLKWERVEAYRWGKTVQKFTLDGNQEYQELILSIKTSWIGKLFHLENTYEDVLRIKLADQDIVDQFLRERLGNMKAEALI